MMSTTRSHLLAGRCCAAALIALIALFHGGPAQAAAPAGAWIFGTNVFANTTGSADVEINFTPLTNRVVLPNGALQRKTKITITTDSNGSIGSNYFVAGPYRVSTPETADTFDIYVPADDAGHDWVTLGTNNFNFVSSIAGQFVRRVQLNSTNLGTAPIINFIAGENTVLNGTNNSGSNSLDIRITATASSSGGGTTTNAVSSIKTNNVVVTNNVTVLEFTNGPANITFFVSAVSGAAKVYAAVDAGVTNGLHTRLTNLEGQSNQWLLASIYNVGWGALPTNVIQNLNSATNALNGRIANLEGQSNQWLLASLYNAAWGALSTNVLTSKLDSNSWWTIFNANRFSVDHFTLTNYLDRVSTNLGTSTNVTVDLAGPGVAYWVLTNYSQFSLANTPTFPALERTLELKVISTGASWGLTFPSGPLYENTPFLSDNWTNRFLIIITRSNVTVRSMQGPVTGSGDTNVLSVQPAVVQPTINGQTIMPGTLILTNPHAFQPPSLNLTNWSFLPTNAMANIPAVTWLTNWANAISNLAASAVGGGIITNGGSGTNNIFTRPRVVDGTNEGTTTFTGPDGGVVSLFGASSGQSSWATASNGRTNVFTINVGSGITAGDIAFKVYSITTSGITNFIVLTNAVDNNSGGGSSGAYVLNSTSIVNSATQNIVVDVARFNSVEIKALTNLNLLVLSNASTMSNYFDVVWQEDTNGAWNMAGIQVVGGLLETNAAINLTTNSSRKTILRLRPAEAPGGTNLSVVFATTNLNARPFTNSLASGGSTTFLINEDFEATGTESGWNAIGSPEFDYNTDPLAGAESLRVNTTGEQAYYNFGGELYPTLYAKLMIRIAGSLPGSATYLYTLSDASTAQQIRIYVQPSGKLGIDHGGTTVETDDAISADATYFVRIRYTKSTGGNGVGSIGWSTTSTIPTSGTKFASTTSGAATANIQHVQVILSGVIDARYDNIQVAETFFE